MFGNAQCPGIAYNAPFDSAHPIYLARINNVCVCVSIEPSPNKTMREQDEEFKMEI